ncbi:MAG TPA: endopeptidase La, partial [Vulgatibacter sp.]
PAAPSAGPSPAGPPPPAAPPGPQPSEPVARDASREATREPILCFVGPPGTGKTSLGQSIARALGRKFAHASLGGIQDEAEIRGHRRTYIGSMPGRIIQALRRAAVADPIFMLDEVDKLGVGFHGDPSSALLEVLDPAQNQAFVDTYLGVPVDLSQVLFICTANTTESIPAPLLDRMELVRLTGYTDEEKVQIARRHLLPAQLASSGLRPKEVEIGDDTIRRVIRDYTREAGVRNLERELAALLRKSVKRIGEGEEGPIAIRPEDLHGYLGPRRFFDEVAERIDRPGIATGLAWTPAGGDIIFVEAAMMPGRKEELILTGMLGNVMRESAQAALTWLRSHARELGIDPRGLLRKTFHVHVPAGAIPKDGPSAGVAILVALTSLATGRLVRPDVAMTGEITLRGKVLPVGGIRDKVLGAYRAGIRSVLVPRHNRGAMEEVPEEVREAIDVTFLDTAEDALGLVFEPLAPTVEESAPPLM